MELHRGANDSVDGNGIQFGNLILRHSPIAPGLTHIGFGEVNALFAANGACTSLQIISGALISVNGRISATRSLNPSIAVFNPTASAAALTSTNSSSSLPIR